MQQGAEGGGVGSSCAKAILLISFHPKDNRRIDLLRIREYASFDGVVLGGAGHNMQVNV